MIKKIISIVMLAVMLCLCATGCGCSAGNSTNIVTVIDTDVDTNEVAAKSSEELMRKLETAINEQDIEAYNQLTTEKMRASTSDINVYFGMIKAFTLKTVAFESNQQEGASYEIPVHYYVNFSKDYPGTQYKTGINNMTDGFTIVKVNGVYKLDAITRYGTN